MKILITGICGFVGSSLAEELLRQGSGTSILGIDNFMRHGSEMNRARLKKAGIVCIHGDIRAMSDWESLPKTDWVIDAAANPSVLAGIQMGFTGRQLLEHNLTSLVNVLEYCKLHSAGLILLSSSRVYSIPILTSIPLYVYEDSFRLDESAALPAGLSSRGIGPDFATTPPISLYGSTKLASEVIALEYGGAFKFPVWVNRCGVLAGAGQFGTPDQGIFAYWINAHLRRRTLRYIGFGGSGKQVRDLFHPFDLATLISKQIKSERTDGRRIYTVGGGIKNSMSLAQLNSWCDKQFGAHVPIPDTRPRDYDVPWIVMDNEHVEHDFEWQVQRKMEYILDEIARHAEQNADWLERSGL